MTNSNESQPVQPNEIDLIEVFKKIWAGRKTIYRCVGVFMVLGIIIFMCSPSEYKSEVTLLVETQSKGGGMAGLLQQVTGISGLNIGTAGAEDALSPQIYPDVIKSKPFLLEIMHQKVTESKYDSTITVVQYLNNHSRHSFFTMLMDNTFALVGKIFKKKNNQRAKITINFNGLKGGPLKLTKNENDIAKSLSQIIKSKEGEANNELIISVEMQDPYVAAQLADSVVKSLTRYVIDYRTKKAKNDLAFITERRDEALNKYKQAQDNLALYSDRNKNVILASAGVEEKRLQNEYNLAFNIYNTLSQQMEQAKLKVQENTPVFKVIDPPLVALSKSKPSAIIILILNIFLGGILGIIIILLKKIFPVLKNI